MRRNSLLMALAACAAASLAFAQERDPVRDVAALVRQAAGPGDTFGLLAGLGKLPDLELDRDQVARALSQGGGPGHFGPVAALLGPASRLRVRGGQVELLRDEPTTTPNFDQGDLAAGTRVRWRVAPDGRVSAIEGLRVGPAGGQLRDVTGVTPLPDGSLRVTAGPPGAARALVLPTSPAPASAPPGDTPCRTWATWARAARPRRSPGRSACAAWSPARPRRPRST